MSVECLFNISIVSTLLKLLRITAFVLRFIDRCKQSGNRPSVQSFSVEELWIAICQHECFQQEQESITLRRCQPPIVRQLKLFIDRDGLLRSGGILHNAPLEENAKFPYLLPSKHTLTKLIIEDFHRKQLHSGVNATLTVIRQKFLILALRRQVQTILKRCVVCKKVNGRPYQIPDPPPFHLRVDKGCALRGCD